MSDKKSLLSIYDTSSNGCYILVAMTSFLLPLEDVEAGVPHNETTMGDQVTHEEITWKAYGGSCNVVTAVGEHGP